MLVEGLQGTRYHKCAVITIPLLSISTLVYFTLGVVQEALGKLSGGGDDDDDVNPYIVLGFCCWCLTFDTISICAFIRNYRDARANGRQINMLAAFAHVSADFARSITELVESILIAVFKWDSVITDAYACLFVSAIILIGASFTLFTWCRTVFSLMQVRPDLEQRGLSSENYLLG